MLDFFSFQVSENHWQQVARSFADTKGRQPTVDLVFLTIVLVLVLLTLSWGWKRFSSRKKAFWVTGTITSPAQLAQIIEQAMFCRSRFDLGFYPTETARPSIPCSLFEISNTSMTLEVPLGVKPSSRWIGRRMICYFYILNENEPPVFYKFISTISNIWDKNNFHYVVLDTPTKINLEQKRKHLRLELQPVVIKDFRLWTATEGTTFQLESNRELWPSEFAVYSPEHGNKLRIRDLSGGGIGLAINPKYYSDLDTIIAPDRILFIRLELQPVGNMLLPPYFLAARLRSKIKEYSTGMLLLGYEFVEYSLDQAAEELQWIKIDPQQGIDDLITWIFKRHLELYREQKIE